MILTEGRKDFEGKLIKQYPEYVDFIKRSFDLSPNNNKYSKWIDKWLKVKLIDATPDNTYYLDSALNVLEKNLTWFEENHTKITKAVLERLKLKLQIEQENIEDYKKIFTYPKDINSYEDIQALILMRDTLSEFSSRRADEREAKSNANKIYEDDKVLVVKPLSYKASCYYGANTKWCTTNKSGSSHYDSYSESGNLYYFIDKKDPMKKTALYVAKKKQGNIQVFDVLDKPRNLNYLESTFPDQKGIIDELCEVTNMGVYDSLIQYKAGKIDKYDLENAIGDICGKINSYYEEKGDSEIVLTWDDDVYFGLFDLGDDDIHFINIVYSSYGGADIWSSDSSESDWDEGYMFSSFNQTNLEKVRQILKVVYPKYAKTDFEDNNENQKIAKHLSNLFESDIDDIVSEHYYAMDRASVNGAREEIEKDFCNFFFKYGLDDNSCFTSYTTTVNNLIEIYENHGTKKEDIISLLKSIAEIEGSPSGDFWSSSYEYAYQGEGMDSQSFNNYVERSLDGIIETISEDENLEEYTSILTTILEKYDIDVWYGLPRNKNYIFKITDIDMDDLNIVVEMGEKSQGEYSEVKDVKTYRLASLDDFYSLLYNYKLFEGFKFKKFR